MGKPTICIGENKDADQLRGNPINAFVFATRIVKFLLYCVGPVRKPHCWFSHEAAQILLCVLIKDTAQGQRRSNTQLFDPDSEPLGHQIPQI